MIELIKEINPTVVRRLIELEAEAFGSGGMNEWHIVPLIRHGRVFALRRGGEIIGAVQYMIDWQNRNKAYVVGVSIDGKWRGQSLGTELMAASLKELSKDSIAIVELTVAPGNAAAIKVYQDKLGFRTAGFLPAEYGEGEDRLLLVKTLERPD